MTSSPEDLSQLPAAESARRQSLRQWETVLKRYPLASGWGLGFQIGSTFFANGMIAWLVATGRMSPFELVVLVAIEALLLIGVAWLHSLAIPAAALEKNPHSVTSRLATLAFGLFWLAGVYGLVLSAFVPSGAEVQRAISDPLAFLAGSNLRWPLIITLVLALVDILRDHQHFATHGGQFISTPGLQGVARWLTLFLGGLPFFVPAVAIMVGVKFFADSIRKWTATRITSPDKHALLATLAMPLIALPFFGTMGWLMSSGVSGWAVGFCAAKFVAELFVVCLPLIASQAHAEESAAPLRGLRSGRGKGSRLP